MAHEQLRQDLERLHHELLHAETTDDAANEALQKLRSDIKSLLADEAISLPHYQSLGDTLKDGVYRFDASHPQLAKTMAQVIDSLALLNL